MAFDLDKLGELEENLRRLAEVPSRIATTASEGISEAIQRQFDQGTDPYGRPWAPLAPSTLARTPGRHGGPLDNEGALRAGVEVRPAAHAGIQVTIEDGEIAGYHQTGTDRMPARKILPDEGMPPEWEEILTKAGEEAFTETMGKKR